MSSASGFAGGSSGAATIGQPITINDGENNEYSAISQAILHYQVSAIFMRHIQQKTKPYFENETKTIFICSIFPTFCFVIDPFTHHHHHHWKSNKKSKMYLSYPI